MRIDLPFRVAIALSIPIWGLFLTSWRQWNLTSAFVSLGAAIFAGAILLNLIGVAVEQFER